MQLLQPAEDFLQVIHLLVNNQFSNCYYTDHIGAACVQTVLEVDEGLLAGQLQMTE